MFVSSAAFGWKISNLPFVVIDALEDWCANRFILKKIRLFALPLRLCGRIDESKRTKGKVNIELKLFYCLKILN